MENYESNPTPHPAPATTEFYKNPDFYSGILGILSFLILPALTLRAWVITVNLTALNILVGTSDNAMSESGDMKDVFMMVLSPLILVASIVILIAALKNNRSLAKIGGGALGGVSLLMMGYIWMGISGGASTAKVSISPGFGLWLNLLLAISCFTWPMIMEKISGKSPVAPPPMPPGPDQFI